MYTCETCKYHGLRYDNDYYCGVTGKIVDGQDTCDSWTDLEEAELTEQEKTDIRGDREAHEIMEREGHV